MNNSAPKGVKIISWLYYIGAAGGVIAGILLIFGRVFLSALLPPGLPAGTLDLGTLVLVVGGVISLVWGAVLYFIGSRLAIGRNWARIVVIIFSIIGLLFSILGFTLGAFGANIFSFIVNAGIAGYLLFSSEAKAFFA